MAGITQDTIIRQDCTVSITSNSGTKGILKFTEFRMNFKVETADARAGQSAYDAFVETHRGLTIDVRGLRGGTDTLYELKTILDDGATITDFSATDLDDDIVAEYGSGQMVSLAGVQPEGPGTFDFQIRFGAATHGYTLA